MRRKDRELTEREDLLRIIHACKVCRIAMADRDRPYIVPMNFGYEFYGDALHLFFHCANEGRKIDILRANNHVCFEMDCAHRLVEGDIACRYGYSYASMIGSGQVEFVEDPGRKVHALSKIMHHQTGKGEFEFDDGMVKAVTVFEIVSEEYSGKRRSRE